MQLDLPIFRVDTPSSGYGVWFLADHFEALGTPSEIATFDKGFFTKVTDSVCEVFSTFVNDPNGILCEPLEYEEVARVCSTLKLGVSGVEIDYEHI